MAWGNTERRTSEHRDPAGIVPRFPNQGVPNGVLYSRMMWMKCAPRCGGRALLAVLLLAACVLATVQGAERPEYRRKAERLQELRKEIDQIQSDLASERNRHDRVDRQLSDLDQRIGQMAARLHQIGERIDQTRDRIDDLRKERDRQQQRLAKHKAYLRREILAAQATGRQEYLRLLLNQEDPARIDRMLVYYDYLSHARAKRIGDAVQQLRRLQVVESSLNDELDTLEGLRKERRDERQQLAAQRDKRQALLARINDAIAAKDKRLARLRKNEEQLKGLVDKLQRALADIPDEQLDHKPFAQRKGHLRWPLAGKVEARYGDSRGVGDMRWKGLLIAAPEGTEVHAVSHGRVVFADWLRGVGMLIIIDHGNGYMTLYGHNQSLYKETGEWVQAGEVIATVGASGGQRGSALYFEVRANGKPVNPMAWLGARGGRG